MTPRLVSLRPAIFLDRDGVLNDVVWRDGKPASPRSVAELTLADGAVEAVAAFKAAGYLTFVVTNQPDVARGKMSGQVLSDIHQTMAEALPVDEIVACQHDNADLCDCRKPRPGMLLDLARRWSVDLSQSWMIGDMDRDIACGQAAGCSTVLIRRPYNGGPAAGADLIADDLTQAVALVFDTQTAARAVVLQG